MKNIGIIGAMDEEVTLLKSKIELVSAKNIVGVDYYMGKIHGNNVIIVRSGIGKVNAAICTQVLIDLYGVDIVINMGIAGGILKDLKVGDVVISKDLLYHDFDATAFGSKLGDIPRMKTSIFEADEELIALAKDVSIKILGENKTHIGRISSGDIFVSSKELKSKIWNEFKSYCVEMEGAAVAHTCHLNKVPFIVIRTISDNADDNSVNSYIKFMEIAAKNSSNIVEELIKRDFKKI